MSGREMDSLRDQLSRLTQLLVRERRCIAALDASSLAEITAEKQALADALRPLLGGLRRDDPAHRELRAIAAQLSTSARINMLLLKDAVAATSARLGISGDIGTYDAHARRNPAARYGGGRAA
jgi:hypothetical protein